MTKAKLERLINLLKEQEATCWRIAESMKEDGDIEFANKLEHEAMTFDSVLMLLNSDAHFEKICEIYGV